MRRLPPLVGQGDPPAGEILDEALAPEAPPRIVERPGTVFVPGQEGNGDLLGLLDPESFLPGDRVQDPLLGDRRASGERLRECQVAPESVKAATQMRNAHLHPSEPVPEP